jgi:hypothetical protein
MSESQRPRSDLPSAAVPHAMPPADVAALIDRVVRAAGACLSWRFVAALRDRTWRPCLPGSPADAAQLKEMEDLNNQEKDAMVDAREAAGLLAPELERIGEDSSGLLRLLHCIAGGGGPDNAKALWPDLKVSLQRLAIRLRVLPAPAAEPARPRRGAPLAYPQALARGVELLNDKSLNDQKRYAMVKKQFAGEEELPKKDSFMRRVRGAAAAARRSRTE